MILRNDVNWDNAKIKCILFSRSLNNAILLQVVGRSAYPRKKRRRVTECSSLPVNYYFHLIYCAYLSSLIHANCCGRRPQSSNWVDKSQNSLVNLFNEQLEISTFFEAWWYDTASLTYKEGILVGKIAGRNSLYRQYLLFYDLEQQLLHWNQIHVAIHVRGREWTINNLRQSLPSELQSGGQGITLQRLEPLGCRQIEMRRLWGKKEEWLSWIKDYACINSEYIMWDIFL